VGQDQLFLDPLSAYHVLIVVGVFALSSIYSCYYFAPMITNGSFDERRARWFGFLWFLFLESMLLTFAANNVGLMWAGMEATTIVSALLVCLTLDRLAVRAAWIYLMMCSVAIALALLGIIVICAEARLIGTSDRAVFLWTELRELAPRMNGAPLRLAFVFAVVGFGTKAGLAPMHSWLPEAHGQAPTPVSAVLSGVLLNCALYCLTRVMSIVEPSSPGWSRSVLIPFGLFSMIIAAASIVHNNNVKRLLGFSSVEHLGIVTLGLGFGAPAAALFHLMNHSVGKMLTFFCAGTFSQRYGSHDMTQVHGLLRTLPVAGGGFLAGLFALIGTPPASVFMSKLWIARLGIQYGHFLAVTVFFVVAAIFFIAAFHHAVEMTRGQAELPPVTGQMRDLGLGLVTVPLALLLVVGLWMPEALSQTLQRAAAVIGGVP
jgi:hydrogenase-4 component F